VFSNADVKLVLPLLMSFGKVVDLADVSWHPLLASTNVPYGLVLKPTDFEAVTLGTHSDSHLRRSVFDLGVAECTKLAAIPGVEEE